MLSDIPFLLIGYYKYSRYLPHDSVASRMILEANYYMYTIMYKQISIDIIQRCNMMMV